MSATKRPTPVTVAITLLWIQAALALVLALVAFLAAGNEGELLKTAAAKGDAAATLRTVLLVGGVVLLVVAIINVIFALRMGRGGRTARLVYTILAVLGILGNLGSALQGQGSHALVIIIPIVILLLLWAPKSSQQFFAAPAEA